MSVFALIHGLWCTEAHLARLRAELESRGHSCCVITLPEHRSHPSAKSRVARYRIDDYVEYAKQEIAREFGEGLPILLGHSFGGLIAQRVAAELELDALVLLAPALPRAIPAVSWTGLVTLGPGVLLRAIAGRPHLIPARNRAYGIYNSLPRRDQTELPRYVFESGRVLRETLIAPFRANGPTDIAADRVCCPVFLAVPGQDRITPARFLRRLAGFYPNVDLFEYPEMSHWMVTEPGIDDVVRDIDAWLLQVMQGERVRLRAECAEPQLGSA